MRDRFVDFHLVNADPVTLKLVTHNKIVFRAGARSCLSRLKWKWNASLVAFPVLFVDTVTDNRSLFVATRVKNATKNKNKVKRLTSKLGTRMETGRLRKDLLGLRVELPPNLLFNGLI